MNKNLLLCLILGLIVSLPSFSCDQHGKTGIVDDNGLWISKDAKSVSTVTEEEFNSILDRIEELYTPIIEEFGATLDVSRNWDDGTVNAYARQIGTTWQISMFGGLARHETITADAFALVACHELGHHIGGAPKKASWYGGSMWASNEGQSDYWGAMKCLKRYMENDDNTTIVSAMEVDEHAKATCEANYNMENDIAICIRSSMAGLSLGNLFRALRRSTTPLSFIIPDTNVVTRTNDSHPASQCRLDTYFAGSVCNRGYDETVSQSEANQGTCNRAENYEAGLRPLCWYAPSTIN
jgi:hypothetical protein